jgi:hypothetical protein
MAMERAGIKAVLTGGACASLHSRGEYQSSDLDFVLQSAVSRQTLDSVMRTIGFRPEGGHYRHPTASFFVEFPPGPLGIGGDLNIQPIVYRVGRVRVLALSATDSCRDRLAAYHHWRDRQSLVTAVAIARRSKVDLSAVRQWTDGEGASQAFEEFRALLDKKGITQTGQIKSPRRPRRRRAR